MMLPTNKESKIKEFIFDIEEIVNPSKVIGFDFIAIGEEDYFQDYLLHPDINLYMDVLNEYFDENPSLLIVPGLGNDQGEVIGVINSSDDVGVGKIQLEYLEEKVGKKKYLKPVEKPPSEYWNNWCNVIQKFNSNCRSIYFIRVEFNNLVQTTALFIYFDLNIEATLEQNGARYRNYLTKASRSFLYEEAVDVFLPRHIKEIERQAIRAAISQVMVRCFSHNIASHVLSKYKTVEDFKSSKMFNQNQYLAEQLQLHLDFKNDQKIFEIEAIQRAYFNEYIKNRMDFLADIATVEYPTLESPLFIKNDILRGLDKNRILLNRISGLDSGVKFDINLKLPNGLKDCLVVIPNDVLGCHAFYIILENIIRNIAKHSKGDDRSNKLDFVITIELSDYKSNPNYYELKISDSLEKDQKKIDDLVEIRNKHFNNKIIDKSTNRLRDTALGSIEMDVCAAYLRKLPITSIEDNFYTVKSPNYFKSNENGINIPNLIHAYAEPLADEKFSLGYKIYLRKPQSLLIIDDKLLGKNNSEIETLKNEGITILARLSSERYKFKPEDEYGHEFLIWLNDSQKLTKFYHDNKSILPVRVLKDDDFLEGFRLNKTSAETKEKVWDIYLKKYLKEKQITGYDINQVNRSIPPYPEICEENNKIYIDDHDDQWNNKFRAGSYYEMCCSHNRLSKMNLYWNKQDKMRYIESAACKVLLIDERIQANIVTANKKYRDNVNFKEYFDNLSIIIPSKDEVNLNQANFGSLKEEFEEDSEEIANKLKHFLKIQFENEKIDFCIIHLGIIEKFFDETEDKSETEISNKIKLLVGESNLDKIVITSGRGKPDNLADTFRYVPLSVIQNYIETLFDKILLVNALYNSRKAK